ncbi:TPA: YkgJ family cysteine cluster protein [Clostridium perfringens]
MFKCDKCGECCRNLNKSHIYDELHNGNGICKYLKGNLCSIYEERPLLCRIDESYEIFFKETMTKSAYYNINYNFCNKLKNNLL